ncbi:hypothetical protein DPV78_005131 [Talaromyces pinophilus]|nr:hypothetical protein DPV78_005131 [Talaromyces pinophilus]
MPPNLFNSSPTMKISPSMQPTVALPENSGQNRAALDIEKQTTPQEFKRPRASYACLPCRARKVRCNVAEGSPCLNCRLDHLQCEVKEHRSRKDLEVQHTVARLPPFLRPLPSNMGPEAIQYLDRMQALNLATVSLQNSLLRAYVEYVHPSLPLMDLHNFLNTVYCRHGRNGQVSLLLYHSVMFAATAFVDIEALCQAGYRTRKEAREKFFQKARLLYDFDYEYDGLVLVQSLLLMTYWDESPGDLKSTWYWMNIAASYCYRVELHRQSRCDVADMPILEQRLRRRVWWCCYMRDGIIALGMRQPPMIEEESFDVPMLVESDFEIEELAYSNTIEQLELTVLQDVKMQQELATLCIETAKLCIPMGQLLRARYSIRSLSHSQNDQGIDSLRSELQTWATSLPDGLQEYQSTVLDARVGISTTMVQRTMLHMLYYTAVWVLHQSKQSSPSGNGQTTSSFEDREAASFPWRHARDAANKISQIITVLHCRHELLTSTEIRFMTPAIIMHLADMEAGVTPARELRQCLLVIEQLRGVYTIADQVASFIEGILTRPTDGVNPRSEHHVVSLLKKELSAAVTGQEADSKNSQSAENILVDAFNTSTPELLIAPPLPDESPFTEQITTPGDNLSGSLVGCIDFTSLNCTNGLVDFDWKTTEETELGSGFWLDENECK